MYSVRTLYTRRSHQRPASVTKKRYNFRLETGLVEAAQRYADDYAISRSAVVSIALSEFLRRRGYLSQEPTEIEKERKP